VNHNDPGNWALSLRKIKRSDQMRPTIVEADGLLTIGIAAFCFSKLPAGEGEPGQRGDGEDLPALPPLRRTGE